MSKWNFEKLIKIETKLKFYFHPFYDQNENISLQLNKYRNVFDLYKTKQKYCR